MSETYVSIVLKQASSISRFQARKVSADFWAAASVFTLALVRGAAAVLAQEWLAAKRLLITIHNACKELAHCWTVCPLLWRKSSLHRRIHTGRSKAAHPSSKDFLADNPESADGPVHRARLQGVFVRRQIRTQHVRTSHLSLSLCVCNMKALAPAGCFGISARQAVRHSCIIHCPATPVLSALSPLLNLAIKSMPYRFIVSKTCGVRGNRDRCIRAPEHPTKASTSKWDECFLCNVVALPTGKRCWFKRCWQQRPKPVLA